MIGKICLPLLHLLAFVTTFSFSPACFALTPENAEESKVEHVFVIRRNLSDIKNIPKDKGVVSHSALLLKNQNGEFFVLEYMGDSKVYLTATKQKVIREYKDEKFAHVELNGRYDQSVTVINWTRQLEGSAVEPKYTPKELKDLMEREMKEYSVWKKEYCHTAQERVRTFLGIKVE